MLYNEFNEEQIDNSVICVLLKIECDFNDLVNYFVNIIIIIIIILFIN